MFIKNEYKKLEGKQNHKSKHVVWSKHPYILINVLVNKQKTCKYVWYVFNA